MRLLIKRNIYDGGVAGAVSPAEGGAVVRTVRWTVANEEPSEQIKDHIQVPLAIYGEGKCHAVTKGGGVTGNEADFILRTVETRVEFPSTGSGND